MASVSKKRPPASHAPGLLHPALGLLLLVAILFVYGQVSHFDFTHYDDPDYVSKNLHVQAGLTADSVRWASTAVVAGHWGPLTMLSHILVYQFFHLDSGLHHLANVLFHFLASLLLFAALLRSTGARWPSAFVAFVFALHPLHVESVAWVAERKDVLSAFFWFLALFLYVRYAEAPGPSRYLLTGLAFALGLMSKTMLVTFPFTLLLFDIWPLRRAPALKLLVEKLPLIGLSAAASIVAYLTQRSAGAVSGIPLPLRLENSLLSYLTYLGQMVWPTRLAVFYPYPDAIALWQAATAFVVLAGISAVAVLIWRTRPYLATGWFWYLGTLVPVIGLVQVGAQAHADHFAYIPMVGLLLILAWGAQEIVERRPRAKYGIAIAGAAVCCLCIPVASLQASYWQDGPRLFQHAVDVTTGDNGWARYNLALEHNSTANELMNSGRRIEAIVHYQAALQVRPEWAEVHNDLGTLLANVPGRSAEALSHFASAVRINPNLAQAQRNLGLVLLSMPGRGAEALAHLEAAQRLQPAPDLLDAIHRLQAAQPVATHP